ncbi:DUF2867 domain-containing protein [Flavobacterium sufflavum]|uniref:DUF2867 domain-containing protein n=1 Tax=Flavobacterium sufflavum TaxID=1921138 RepID=A0A3S3SWB3_9FLAO|nr:DUF2867 domain-containing protein [Flavobacterium sufflavum]RVT76543.1 DUF2867 domain-containing protein [Flavobacterium sufflavum]
MKIIETVLPNKSILKNDGVNYDFVDSFVGEFSDNKNTITSATIGKAFFTSAPNWVGKLFTLRNKIVSLFGLKTSGNSNDRQAQLDNFKCQEGEQLGLFKVFSKTEDELILGEDDKHLNFRISLFIDKQTENHNKSKLVISTTVKFHNAFGRMYFLPVRPFHKLIVPKMLKGIINQLENEK